ncbi:hypothetical protein BJF90_09205 [Pseudonocardia sp. CNS-004]|nr:hypothetical protein BJF90_09205 [Pseudonocardia sp. CNS-004]
MRVQFLRTVLDGLRSHPTVEQLLTQAGYDGVPGQAVLDHSKARNEARAAQLELRHDLLVAVARARKGNVDPQLMNALMLIYFARARESQRTIDPEPLNAAVRILIERVHSLTDPLRHEAMSPQERARLAAAHRVLVAAAVAVIEIVLDPAERSATRAEWWAAQDLANAAPSRVRPNSLLHLLLVLADRDEPITAEALQAAFTGRVATWQRRLNLLVGTSVVTGDKVAGYTVREDLRELWKAASPRMREAMRRDPTQLPGGQPIVPLLAAGGVPAGQKEITSAARLVVEMLRRANTAERPHDDGLWATVIRLARRGGRSATSRSTRQPASTSTS